MRRIMRACESALGNDRVSSEQDQYRSIAFYRSRKLRNTPRSLRPALSEHVLLPHLISLPRKFNGVCGENRPGRALIFYTMSCTLASLHDWTAWLGKEAVSAC